MNPYEMTFIVRPDLEEEQTRAAIESVAERISSQGGEVVATYQWNPPRRRLAYPIKDFSDGYYVTTVFRFASDGLKEFERGLRLNTGVLRFLILQATDTNIQQGQQRAQQAAARAAAPPPEQVAPAPAPQAEAPQAAPEPAEEQRTPVEHTAPVAEVAATPEPEAVAPAAETETQPKPIAKAPARKTDKAQPKSETAPEGAAPVIEEIAPAAEPEAEPEPVATAPAGDKEE